MVPARHQNKYVDQHKLDLCMLNCMIGHLIYSVVPFSRNSLIFSEIRLFSFLPRVRFTLNTELRPAAVILAYLNINTRNSWAASVRHNGLILILQLARRLHTECTVYQIAMDGTAEGIPKTTVSSLRLLAL